MPLRLAILVSGRGSNMSAILDAIKSGELDASVSVVFSNNPEAKALEIATEHGVPIESLTHKGMSREEHEEKVLEILSRYEIDYVVLAGYMRVLSPRFLRSFKGIAERDGSLGATPSVALTDKNIQSEGDIPLDRLPGREAGKMPALPGSNSGQRRPDGPPCSQKPIGFSPDDLYRIINIHPSLLPSFPGAHAYEDAWEAGVPESGITIHLVDELVDHGPILQQGSFARQSGDTIDSFKARGLQLEHQLYPAVLNQIAQKGIIRVLEEFAGITSSSSTSNCSDPASSGILPASNCSDPGSAGILPASNCSDPASSGVLPASNCSDPGSAGILPASNCSDSASSGVLPASNCSDSASSGVLPASNCSDPGSAGILPASESTNCTKRNKEVPVK